MIQILVLEDYGRKANKIVNCLIENTKVTLDDVVTVSDVISAKQELGKKYFDVLILDINIPLRFDREPDKQGGIDFVKELTKTTFYFNPPHIIGITSYEELVLSADKENSEYFWDILFYDESSEQWSNKLSNKINYIINTYGQISHSVASGSSADAVIICAVQNEFQAFMTVFGNLSRITVFNDPTHYYETVLQGDRSSLKIIFAQTTEMGMSAAAVLTTKCIYNFRPELIIMGGITAGVKDRVNYGDIIIADPSYDYGMGKYIGYNGIKNFLPDPRQIRIDVSILEKIRTVNMKTEILSEIQKKFHGPKPESQLKVEIGPIASGSAVIADSNSVKEIIEHNRKLLGIEMETYAVYFASNCALSKHPQFVSIKSVCDFADSEKNDTYQEYAAFTSAYYIKELLKELFK